MILSFGFMLWGFVDRKINRKTLACVVCLVALGLYYKPILLGR